MENAGTLIGPIVAGLVLVLAGPAAAIAVATVFLGLATMAIRRLIHPDLLCPRGPERLIVVKTPD